MNESLLVLSQYSDEERQEALRKYRLIEPFLQKEKSLNVLHKEHQLPLRTARRWVAHYRQHGFGALMRQDRKDKGIRYLSHRICSLWMTTAVQLQVMSFLFSLLPQLKPLFVSIMRFGEKKNHNGQFVVFRQSFIQTMVQTLLLNILSRFVLI